VQPNVQNNKTPSIIKFISKLPHKRDKQINAESVEINEESTGFKSSVAAEKRNLSDCDESNVKRLKLEDSSKLEVSCQNNKENKVVCITLE
jgi:hypothetical protein